ncbi:MAG TPA: PEFG-CTERM sorting domain-containing protein [Nitrosopumilaceae archaeon]|nr:PEFG-CTERM sorting domain-containing protein [Nitrosopumilaceae archaeon]
MNRNFFGFVLVLLFSISVIPAFSEEDDEKLSFGSYLEETLGHLWALEQNLDDNNKELAIIHATHPVAELYDLMKPELEEHDAALDAQLRQILFELNEKTTSGVTREQAQEAIDQAKDVVEIARATVIGSEGEKMTFKINLMINLLETSIVEYEEAVSDGQIREMAEFQDGSAFVWRSQQIYETIKSEVPEHEAEEIAEFYEDLWKAYDERTDPETVETLASGIVHELEEVAGIEMEVTELGDYVTNIRSLLTEAKEEYEKGETDEALSFATKAYLDNYEFLESAVGAQDPELNEEIEHMMREELRDMIKNGAPVSEVSAHIDEILLKMDTVAVIVPEFGPMAFVVLVTAIVTIVALSIKYQKLNLVKRF